MIDWFSRWGLLGISLMYALEAIGIPVPIEIPLWLSGQLLHQGQASYWQLVLITWTGTAAGNILVFILARHVGKPLLALLSTRLRMDQQVARMQRWIDRYGLGAVVFSRWINWGYALSMWLIGCSELSPGRTLTVVLINNAVWSCAWVLLGRSLAGALSLSGLPGWLMLVPGGVILGVLACWRLIKHLREKEELS